MRILSDVRQYQRKSSRDLFLGIGNFDGLHLGHQALLERVLSEARQHGGIPAILTFRIHPQQILHPENKQQLLFSAEYKNVLLARAGIEICFQIDFTEKFSQIDPFVFAREWLCEKLKVREVCMGYNARFGKGRRGDGALMAHLARELGFEFCRIPPVRVGGESVSSSRVRNLVREGRLGEIAACLGRSFSLMSEVVHGAGRGSDLGFPTANLKIGETVLPPCGVYTAWTRVVEAPGADGSASKEMQLKSGKWFKSVLNLGIRPTFKENKPEQALEVFILDQPSLKLYGQRLEVVFERYLRPEKAFTSIDALKKQIHKDVLQAQKLSHVPAWAVL
ncbi:MAG: riboflavin biosynthesis protein RibF [Candidatus Omnitrophica bacterium]|nr:riboflavin biosynthesis protein RibF [Candidatus Omnitrophota bacterium]